MGGAYTAKAAASSTPDVPTGWDIDWTFPGPFPPGYEPDLSFNVDAGVTYVPAATHAAEITLRDQGTYATDEPSGSITLVASISGQSIGLKFNGDASFSDSLTKSYSEVGDYYGASATLLFDVTAANEGDIIVLTATGNPFTGQSVSKTHNIEVVIEDVYTAIFSCDYAFVSPGAGSKSSGIKVYGDAGDGETPFGQARIIYSSVHGYTITTEEDPDDEFDVTSPGEELTGEYQIDINLERDELYTFNIVQANGSSGEDNCDYTLTIYKNGEQLEQETKTIDIDYIGWWGSDPVNGNTWITFDRETETLTVVN